MTISNELLDNAITFNHLIWIMSDEDYECWVLLSKLHVSLANEHLNPTTSPERKNEIVNEIEQLRSIHATLIQKYTN